MRVRLDDDSVAEADLVGSIRQDSLIWEGHSIPLPLEGRHNARNLLLACAVASELGVSTTALQTLKVSVPEAAIVASNRDRSPCWMRPTTRLRKR